MGTILLIICLLFLQRFGENVGQVMDPNHASMLKSAATPGQPSGYAYLTWLTLSRFSHCIFFGPYALTANVLLAGPTQAGNNLTLKGWPLTVSSAL
ncbi:hypothetical protein BHM03_00028070 [Ensete ventricosum]|nr:hypothetical protein BHM03_00028070 [Ensete ventricosum]